MHMIWTWMHAHTRDMQGARTHTDPRIADVSLTISHPQTHGAAILAHHGAHFMLTALLAHSLHPLHVSC